ncbi:MAG: hypothetical protein GY793_04940 [Proteobacteria bacterium]|nr:hypothetical protein [Pseudomonadota bacterium]
MEFKNLTGKRVVFVDPVTGVVISLAGNVRKVARLGVKPACQNEVSVSNQEGVPVVEVPSGAILVLGLPEPCLNTQYIVPADAAVFAKFVLQREDVVMFSQCFKTGLDNDSYDDEIPIGLKTQFIHFTL